jgi:ribosomal 50S subunit-recycling heat shock protein
MPHNLLLFFGITKTLEYARMMANYGAITINGAVSNRKYYLSPGDILQIIP